VSAKVILHNKIYWFDPTIASERSSLLAHQYAEHKFALPVVAGTNGLDRLAQEQPQAPLSEVEEHYALGSLEGPVTLTVKTWLRGSRADEFRGRLEQHTIRGIMREYLNFFSKRFDEVEFLQAPTISDDQSGNVVTIVEQYRIASLMREGVAHVGAWSFEDLLAPPDVVRRSSPLAINNPYLAQHRVILSYEKRPVLEPPEAEISDQALNFTAKSEESKDGHHMTIVYTIRSLADAVPAERIRAHLALRRRIDSETDIVLTPSVAARDEVAAGNSRGSAFAAGAVTGTFAAIALLGLRRLSCKRRRANSIGAEAGETSESTG